MIEIENMQALILANQQGSCLLPLTHNIPQAMVPVCNRPILEHLIIWLKKQGIREIHLAIHFQPQIIEKYFGNGSNWGVNLNYSLEKQPFGLADTIKKIRNRFSSSLLVIPTSMITNIQIKPMIEYHQKKQGKATFAVVENQYPSIENHIQTDHHNRILDFEVPHESVPPDSTYTNTGISILDNESLTLISEETNDFYPQCFTELKDKKDPKCYAYVSDDYWLPVNNTKELSETQQTIFQQRMTDFIPEYPEKETGIWISKSAVIADSAKIKPPAIIGEQAKIMDDTQISNACVGNHCQLDVVASLSNTTMMSSTYIGPGMSVKNSIVDQNFMINTESNVVTVISDNRLVGKLPKQVFKKDMETLFHKLIALFLLVLFSPFLLVNLFILLYKKQPLFTRQEKMGEFGYFDMTDNREKKRFYLYQFSDKVPFFSWLPQLFNVLKGDMKLVGNKPLSPEEAEKLIANWQTFRFECPVGIFTLHDISKTNQEELPDEKIITENIYAAKRSFWYDMVLLGKNLIREINFISGKK